MFRYVMMGSASALAVTLMFAAPTPAHALSMKECGEKYQAAKKADTLKGQKWNDFRKAECGDDDVSAEDAAKEVKDDDSKTAATPPAGQKAGAGEKMAPKPSTKTAGKTTGTGAVKFPTAVSDKYSTESPGKARMHTCLDQYNVNKEANGGTAPMKWIEKGGGYYSECNTKLKS